MRCIDLVAQAQRREKPVLADDACGGAVSAPPVAASQKRPIDEASAEADGISPVRCAVPYLCTGYDAYVTVEPCAMCAMALVHSRIRRLIYALPAVDGALGSHYHLHTERSLNHHFQVFRGLLEAEALALDPTRCMRAS